MESMKRFIKIVIQINILINMLTSVRTDNSPHLSSFTRGDETYTTANISKKEQKSSSRTLDLMSASIISSMSSISIPSTTNRQSMKSLTASSSLHNTMTSQYNTMTSMFSSTMAVKQMSSSTTDVIVPTNSLYVGNTTSVSGSTTKLIIDTSISKVPAKNLSEVLIETSSTILIPYTSSDLSSSLFTRSLTSESSSVNAEASSVSAEASSVSATISNHSGRTSTNKSSDYSSSIKKSFSISSTNTLNISLILPSIHDASSGITSMVVLNSTSVPLFIINSTVYSESITPSQTFSMNSTVPMSICPTTTIYVNCSSEIIQSISPVVNFSSIYISDTASVSTNVTSIANSSSIYITPTADVSTIYGNSSTIFVTPTANVSIYANSSSIYATPTANASIYANSSSISVTPTTNVSTPSSNMTTHIHRSTLISIANFTSTASSISNSTSILTALVSFTSTYSYSNTSVPVSTFTVSPSSTAYIISSAHIINPPITKCDAFLSEFTDAHIELSKCMLHKMHPMRVCSNCSDEYNRFSSNHKKIFIDCGDILIYDYNLKYQVIPKMFSAQEATWHSLECDKCYVKDDDGKSHGKSPEFAAFIELYVKLNACFKNHTHVSLIHLPNSTVTNITYDKDVCTDCLSIYKHMQERYEYYGDDGEDTKWCADINVAVNETRHKWSNDLNCGHKAKDLESVIALTAFFCFLPIVFYVGAKLHSDVRERKSANRYNYDSE